MISQPVVGSEWREHIISTPEVLSGKPRIKGTRISVASILGYLAAGSSIPEIIKEYPDLTSEQIFACLNYAREMVEYKIV
ncbi:MAG: DUF433 domain-containing protein [Blastocatellia bacterium]|nr:DUF433 domain-containing protein [Blastocatellia bacterium]